MESPKLDTKCPLCGHENIQGEDRCVECLHSLMHRALPKPQKNDQLQRTLMTTPISEIPSEPNFLVARPQDTLAKVVKTLQKNNQNCVLVYEKHHLRGIMSFRDLLKRVAGHHPDLSKVKVEAVMTPGPEFVKSDALLSYVLNKMATGGFRHIPVLDDAGFPISIVSINDVLRFLARKSRISSPARS